MVLTAQNMQGKKYFNSDSQKIKEIFHFSPVDSALEGSYESFHINGSLENFGWYKNNLPDSIWKYYYENGRKKATGRFRNGEPNGRWEYFFENGNIKSIGILKGQIKEGEWEYFFENGGEKNSGKYHENRKIGIWNYLYEDGSIKAQVVYKEKKGLFTEFYPFGGVKAGGETISDRSEGEWIYYYETGEVEAIGKFEKGLRIGPWEYFYKNGKIQATGDYKNGGKSGGWKYYYENGAIRQSGKIQRGKKESYWKLFYPTGEIQGEVTFDQGAGEYSEYYINGGKKSTGQLAEGGKEGKWIYYSENGQVEGEAIFQHGEGDYMGYYPDRSLKMKGRIKDGKRVGQWTLYNPDSSVAGTYTPIYENEKPIFKTRLSGDISFKGSDQFDKPEYKFKRRGSRYFQSRINEYRGVILGTNPAWLAGNQLPIAIEYYFQERLGYEIQLTLIRDPFFISDENIGNYTLFKRGSRFSLKQKLYREHGKLGMFYFGHQMAYTYINYQAHHPDTLLFPSVKKFGNMIESGFSYGVFIGNRWMKDVGDSGWTIDVFLGLRVAGRSYSRKFEPDPILDAYFDPSVRSFIHFPVIFGLNFGLVGPDNQSKTQ